MKTLTLDFAPEPVVLEVQPCRRKHIGWRGCLYGLMAALTASTLGASVMLWLMRLVERLSRG